MDSFVMRHPDTDGVGVVPETALEHYRLRGWLRVSDPLGPDERDQVHPADYTAAPDLDAPEPDPEPSAKASSAKPSKEK